MENRKKSLTLVIYDSAPVQILLTVIIYGFYAMVLGFALVPSVLLLGWFWGVSIGTNGMTIVPILLFSLALGSAVWIYFIWGSIFMASLVRLLTIGLQPGRYPKASVTTLRWLLQSGIQTMAMVTILPFICVSYFTNLYYKIIGARIGRNVYIRAVTVVDAFLLTLEDGVILGGGAEVSCHFMEPEHLVLARVLIGEGSLIGTGAYIAPGTTVGKHCIVGARSYIRQGITIPDRSVYTVLAGMPIRNVQRIEKHQARGM